MTAAPLRAAPVTLAAPLPPLKLTFGRVVASEWIKLRTLRSTFWCAVLIVVLNVGLAALLGLALNREGTTLPAEVQRSYTVLTATLGVRFTQLIAAVLGVLVISGEFGTGMIRSTFAAVPRRTPAIVAKIVVLGVALFVVGLLSIAAAVVASAPLLSANGVSGQLGNGDVLLALVGAAGYLTLVGLLAFGFGAILRNSAAGIATVIGLLLVVPIVLQIVAGLTDLAWIRNILAVLPSQAGALIFTYASKAPSTLVDSSGLLQFSNWQGLVVLVLWVALVLIGAFALVKRRDA